MLEELAGIDYPFYVQFFIMAGAELHLEALLHMGWIGTVYVVARSLGKFAGCRAGARLAGMSPTIETWLGSAMLAQAGLANVLATEWPGPGKDLQTTILAAVVVFEMVGPLLTRISDELVGVVKYADIADTLFDPVLRHLVVAAEIASDAFLRLTPDDTLKAAMLALKQHPEATFLLVVAPEDRSKLVGIVSHSDLLAAQLHQF